MERRTKANAATDSADFGFGFREIRGIRGLCLFPVPPAMELPPVTNRARSMDPINKKSRLQQAAFCMIPYPDAGYLALDDFVASLIAIPRPTAPAVPATIAAVVAALIPAAAVPAPAAAAAVPAVAAAVAAAAAADALAPALTSASLLQSQTLYA